MSAFDTAWDLLKAPYHGTTTDRLEEIMRDGLQPRGSFRDRDEQGGLPAVGGPSVLCVKAKEGR